MGDDSEEIVQVENCYIFQLALTDNLIIYDTGASVSIFKSMYGYAELALP